jgi:hypothetical protein
MGGPLGLTAAAAPGIEAAMVASLRGLLLLATSGLRYHCREVG